MMMATPGVSCEKEPPPSSATPPVYRRSPDQNLDSEISVGSSKKSPERRAAILGPIYGRRIPRWLLPASAWLISLHLRWRRRCPGLDRSLRGDRPSAGRSGGGHQRGEALVSKRCCGGGGETARGRKLLIGNCGLGSEIIIGPYCEG